MALKYLRDNLRHLKFILWGVVVVFVLLVFVDWGSGRSGGRGGGTAAVRVGDRAVSETEFISELRRMNDRFQQQFGDQWNQLRGQVDLAGQTVAYFIDRELHLAEAKDAGLVVSDDELREAILQTQLFQAEDGSFVGQDRYERIIRSYFQMGPQEFESRFEEDLLIAKLNAMVERGVFVANDEIEDDLRREREVADLGAIQIRYERFLNDVEITDDQLLAHYEANRDDYLREEQRVIRYLVVETSRLRRTLPVTDEELRAYYDEHQADFVLGEQAQARHILFRLTPGADGSQRAEVKLRADSVLKIAQTGADFAELAAKHSDDPGSKDNGGDLGWFGRGEMVPEFEAAVFNAKPGEILGPVESQFGLHIIKVEAFKPEQQQPFEEVEDQVKFRVLEGRAAAETEIQAAALARRVAADGPDTDEAWQAIADEDEVVVLNVSPPFGAGQAIPGTGGCNRAHEPRPLRRPSETSADRWRSRGVGLCGSSARSSLPECRSSKKSRRRWSRRFASGRLSPSRRWRPTSSPNAGAPARTGRPWLGSMEPRSSQPATIGGAVRSGPSGRPRRSTERSSAVARVRWWGPYPSATAGWWWPG